MLTAAKQAGLPGCVQGSGTRSPHRSHFPHTALARTPHGRCPLFRSQLTSGRSWPASRYRTQGLALGPVGWAGQRTRILKGRGEDDPAGRGPHFGSHCLQGSQASERKAQSLESASENSKPEQNPCRQTSLGLNLNVAQGDLGQGFRDRDRGHIRGAALGGGIVSMEGMPGCWGTVLSRGQAEGALFPRGWGWAEGPRTGF